MISDNSSNAVHATNIQGFWQKHSDAWKVSALTQSEYCKQQNISYASFVYQHSKILAQLKQSDINFINVQSNNKIINENNHGATLQLILSNGNKINITNEVNIKLLQMVLTVMEKS